MMEGGCYCKAIRYSLQDGAYRAVNCHCTMCRRIHAAPYVAWLVVPVAHFEYVAGQPAALRSSPAGTRYFCPRCGTHVACVNDAHPEIIDIAIGSLDAPEAHAPYREVHEDTRLPWVGGATASR